jgi:hypothetical protein
MPKNAPDVTVSHEKPPPRSAAVWWLSWSGWGLLAVFGLVGGALAFAWGSPTILAALILLVGGSLALRLWLPWGGRRQLMVIAAMLVLLLVAAVGVRTFLRYSLTNVMEVPVREYSNAEYPENPAAQSVHHGKYNGRMLTLVQKDATHFDFILTPKHPHIAKIVFRDVDVSLMTPSLPAWTKADTGLRRIALTDRQWSRQQVRFDAGSPHVEVTGGDGFEQAHLFTAELAKNCLNAGFWEVLLFVKEGNDKVLYYQGWFTFPLGHYKRLFEHNTGLAYARHWYYLEHWFDPVGTKVPMAKLRQVTHERAVPTTFDRAEKVFTAGEQTRKRRTTLAENVVTWGDFYEGRSIRFAAFIPPGRYSVKQPWKNKYGQMDRFEHAILRQIVSPATDKPLHELELVFTSRTEAGKRRFFVSGFDLHALPQLPMRDYPKGLYMPMGIGVPPFFQSYEEVRQHPPYQSPYVSVLLDADDKWIDHHTFGIDGPVMHRDDQDPDVLHVYLLSYERHSLVGHFLVSTQPF